MEMDRFYIELYVCMSQDSLFCFIFFLFCCLVFIQLMINHCYDSAKITYLELNSVTLVHTHIIKGYTWLSLYATCIRWCSEVVRMRANWQQDGKLFIYFSVFWLLNSMHIDVKFRLSSCYLLVKYRKIISFHW